MLNKLIFYNPYHNGDLHLSRAFVEFFIKNKTAKEYIYCHNQNPEVLRHVKHLNFYPLKDALIQNEQLPGTFIDRPELNLSNSLFLNTWIGQQNKKFYNPYNGCTLQGNYELYKSHIKTFNLDLQLEEIDKYIPQIKLRNQRIQQYFKFLYPGKCVFISNGYVHSGQAYNFDFDPIIDQLSNDYPDYLFVLTNRFNLEEKDNLIYTRKIHGKLGFDMNENSYISKYCKFIIGRSSGSFVFSIVKENWLDPEKVIIGFGHSESDAFWYKPKGKSVFYNGSSDIYKIISENL